MSYNNLLSSLYPHLHKAEQEGEQYNYIALVLTELCIQHKITTKDVIKVLKETADELELHAGSQDDWT